MTAHWLRDAPVQRKVSVVIFATTAAAFLVASILVFAYQRHESRRRITEDLQALAQIVAANSTAAVSFGDARVATEVLEALRARRHLLDAAIDRDGRRFAAFVKDPGRPAQDSDLVLEEPVMLDGERLGTLFLRFDFGARSRELLWVSASGLASALVSAIVVALALSARLHHVITGPILELARTAQRVAEHRDFSERAPAGGRDEVGRLTDAFNEMLGRIESQDASLRSANAEQQRSAEEMRSLHEKLVETSRRAGMAEVASGVLHNVGNVLTSVNVSANWLAEHARLSRVDRVRRVAALVRARDAGGEASTPRATEERGPADYLELLADHLEGENSRFRGELAALCKSIDHMKEVVAMHQSYARASGLVETVRIDTLVEDALHLGAGELRQSDVEVVREYDEAGSASLEKNKVLQILVNLIRNARQALEGHAVLGKRLIVRTRLAGEGRVRIEVADNGVGISLENLDRIFALGFTTRPEGHGFGLHNSAVAAQEMGGSLNAQSAGPEQGATFVLELPREPRSRESARGAAI